MRRWAGILSFCVGCTNSYTELGWSLPADAQSVVLSVTGAQGRVVKAVAVRPGEPVLLERPTTADEVLTVEVATLTETLVALDWLEGDQPQQDRPRTYPLPLQASIQRAAVQAELASAWAEVSPPDALYDSLMFGSRSLACLERGGCTTEEDPAECSEACEAPTLLPPEPPLPPEPVQALTSTPCPSGWSDSVVRPGVLGCQPWATLEPASCPDGWATIPGEPACSPVSVPCPAGRYAADLPVGPILYVDAEAPSGGDGSVGAPFASLEAAVNAAGDGTTIALAKGAYDGGLLIQASVTLQGACAEAVSIVAPPGAWSLGLFGAVELRDLSLVGGTLTATAGAQVHLGGIEIRDSPSRGLQIDGAAVTLTSAVIRRTAGQGVHLQGGGTLVADQLELVDVGAVGVFAALRSEVQLGRATIRSVSPDSGGDAGYGLWIASGASATLAEVAVQRTYTAGLVAGGPGTRVTAEQLWIHQVASTPSGAGDGLGLIDGATAEISRSTVWGPSRHGAAVFGGARGNFTDLLLVGVPGGIGTGVYASGGAATGRRLSVHAFPRGARASEGGHLQAIDLQIVDSGVIGLDSNDGGLVELTRAVVRGVDGVGVAVDPQGQLIATDLEVSDIDGEPARGLGAGVVVTRGGRLQLERAYLHGFAGAALGSGATDTALRDVRIEASDPHGGLVMIGGTLDAQRVALGTPFLLEEATTVNLTDLLLRAEANPLWACKTVGVQVGPLASLVLERAVLDGLSATGVVVDGALTARHLAIHQTRAAPIGCPGGRSVGSPGLGEALVATRPSKVTLEGFEIRDAPIGVVVAEGATVSLRHGHLRQVVLGIELYGRRLPDLARRVSIREVNEPIRLRAP